MSLIFGKGAPDPETSIPKALYLHPIYASSETILRNLLYVRNHLERQFLMISYMCNRLWLEQLNVVNILRLLKKTCHFLLTVLRVSVFLHDFET